jgi:hypothetical protein
MVDRLVELSGRGKKDTIGSLKAEMIEVRRDWRGSSLDEDVMLGTDGFEDGDS